MTRATGVEECDPVFLFRGVGSLLEDCAARVGINGHLHITSAWLAHQAKLHGATAAQVYADQMPIFEAPEGWASESRVVRARSHAASRSRRSRATSAVADSRIASASSDNT